MARIDKINATATDLVGEPIRKGALIVPPGSAHSPTTSSATMKHMPTVGIRALKQNASEVVRQAAAGDVITITDRGKPVARMVPIRTSRLAEMRNAGLVRRATRRPDELTMPTVEVTDGPTLSDALRELRDDERY